MPSEQPKPAGIDKRKHRRVLVVKPVKARDHQSDFGVHLMNISLSGAQIYANQKMEIGNRFSLELPCLVEASKVVLNGKIVWIHKNQMEFMGRYAYGLQFEEVTDENIKFLEQNFYLGENGGLPPFLSTQPT